MKLVKPLIVYAFDIFEGEKGVIIARSMGQAKSIFRKEYPEIVVTDDHEKYLSGGCYIYNVNQPHPCGD